MARKLDDLTGQRFGRLVVIKRADNHITITHDKQGHVAAVKYFTCWLCQCDCGNTYVAYAHHLKGGHVKSCGCLRVEKSRNRLSKLKRA